MGCNFSLLNLGQYPLTDLVPLMIVVSLIVIEELRSALVGVWRWNCGEL